MSTGPVADTDPRQTQIEAPTHEMVRLRRWTTRTHLAVAAITYVAILAIEVRKHLRVSR